MRGFMNSDALYWTTAWTPSGVLGYYPVKFRKNAM